MTRRYSLAVETLGTAVASFLLVCLLRPEFFLAADIRFTAGHDIELAFQSAFVHAGYFMRGVVDLWNLYDQATHAYIHLGTTFHAPAVVIEGAAFAALHPLFDRPGEAFQHFHAIAFFFLACVVRTVGGVALLTFYNVGAGARIISLVLLNTLVAGHMYDGALSGFAFSLSPLVMFYLALLARSRTVVTAVLAIGAYGVVFATIPLLSLGYGYMPIHFLVVASVCMVLWDVVHAKRSTGSWSWTGVRLDLRVTGRLVAMVVALALAWIVATNVHYLHLLLTTFFVFGSGLGETDGRFAKMLRPFEIFRNAFTGPSPEQTFVSALNFERNDWWQAWLFVGAAVIGLFVIGFIISRRREKWIYGVAALLTVFSAQFDPARFSIGWIAHAITSFTNPFAFLIRDTGQSMLLVPYIMWPVVAFGLDALQNNRSSVVEEKPGVDWRRSTALLALAGLATYAWLKLPITASILAVAVFLCLMFALFHGFVGGQYRLMSWRFLPLAAVVIATALDLGGLARNLRDVPYTGDRIQPRLFAGLEKFGPLVIDYQNPVIMPMPRHLYVGPADEIAGPRTPSTDPGFPTEFAIYFTMQDDPGAFYHTIFSSRHFFKARIYEQRGIRFKGADTDLALQEHLRRNDRYIYHASVALDAGTHSLREIVEAGADQFAAILEDPMGGRIAGAVPTLAEGGGTTVSSAGLLRFDLSGKAVRARIRKELVEFDIPLPEEFPHWIASAVFGRDGDALRLVVDGQPFVPTQGYLIRPSTFDVGNVRSGHLVIAMPTAVAPKSIQLEVELDPLIRNVGTARNDRLDLSYMAPTNGWMIIRNPYEEGWQAQVNGVDVPILIANGTAMAVPVREGLNKITLQYKPGLSLQRVLVTGYLVAGPLLLLLLAGFALCIVGRSPVVEGR